jgi:hypothetical protein
VAIVRITGDTPTIINAVFKTARETKDVFWIQSLDPEVLVTSGMVISGEVQNVVDRVRGLEDTYVDYLG